MYIIYVRCERNDLLEIFETLLILIGFNADSFFMVGFFFCNIFKCVSSVNFLMNFFFIACINASAVERLMKTVVKFTLIESKFQKLAFHNGLC